MKQAVFDGYSFSNARGEYLVYKGKWWKIMCLAHELVGHELSDTEALWLDTFTEINPAPSGSVKVLDR